MSSTNKPLVAPIVYEPLGLPRYIVAITTLIVSVWYLWWRLGTFNPEAAFFSYLLYAGEVFGLITLMLHFYMVRNLTVREAPFPEAGHTVDIFIPTLNEPVDIVRRTVITAMNMDYPHKTYILDDGNRPEMRALSEELGCEYITREDNEEAKAGNLNNALKHTTGEFIAIFDADHAPKQTFLTRTLGYFNDPKVAFVQTPQDFYNLDSYQHRTIKSTGRVWTEQSLFFRVIQRGKDYHNAAFFCGSCAVVRRSALEAINGFATGTITEDIHTSIRMHKYGFRSVYHSESLAFGIAPSQIEPFIKQRIRWGQGAMQVWRKEGVFFNRHLTFAQKLNYIASMSIYFDGWQKFLYYITPAIVLTTGMMPLVTNMEDFLIHFIPFFVMSIWCFEELGRGYGEMLFVEQYNMARFAAFCYATLGLFRDRLKFRVTNKEMSGSRRQALYMGPQFMIFLVNAVAVPAGILLYNQYHHLTWFSMVANMMWASVNMVLCAMVIRFSLRCGKFQRANYRFAIPLVARVQNLEGKESFASIDDLSCSGLSIKMPRELGLSEGEHFTGTLYLPEGPITFEANIKGEHESEEDAEVDSMGCEFVWNDKEARKRLEQFLYGSDLEWHLHNLSEINWTPLTSISGKQHTIDQLPSWEKTRASRIVPMMLQGEDKAVVQTGIMSVDRENNTGTILTFKPLAEDSTVETVMLTDNGRETKRTKIANQNRPHGAWSNMYLYKLEQPA